MLRVNISSVVWCDGCGCNMHMPNYGKLTMVAVLREKGWAIGKKCLCPACREKPKEYYTHKKELANEH